MINTILIAINSACILFLFIVHFRQDTFNRQQMDINDAVEKFLKTLLRK